MKKAKYTSHGVKLNENTEADSDNPFDRLPDDLLISIFNLVVDLKSLFQCSLVSKRFASVIPQTQIVSVIVPSPGEYTSTSCFNMCDFFYDMRRAGTLDGVFVIHPYLQKFALPILFLNKFKELETIYIKYKDPRDIGYSSFPKWKVKCSSSATTESWVSLIPSVVYKETEKSKVEEEYLHMMTLRHIDEASPCIAYRMEWLCHIGMLVKTHSSLKMVTVTYAEDQEKFILRDEQLVNLRSRVQGVEVRNSRFKMAWIPELHLPISGYIMRHVLVSVFYFQLESCLHGFECDETMSWNFGDDEKILDEAIREILTNHMHTFAQ